MKRNVNIIPLSRDHHYGLLFCWKIRQGLAKGIPLDRIRPYVLHFWKNNLEEHFQEEETLLFRDMFDPLCLRAMEEHRQIKDLVMAIDGSGAWVQSYYSGLADMVDKHIRFEEREVFPFLETKLSEEQLTQVGTLLSSFHDKPTDDMYEDAFWN